MFYIFISHFEFSAIFFKCSGLTTPGQLWAMPRFPFGLPRLPCLQIDKNILCDTDAIGQLPRLTFYSGSATVKMIKLSRKTNYKVTCKQSTTIILSNKLQLLPYCAKISSKIFNILLNHHHHHRSCCPRFILKIFISSMLKLGLDVCLIWRPSTYPCFSSAKCNIVIF